MWNKRNLAILRVSDPFWEGGGCGNVTGSLKGWKGHVNFFKDRRSKSHALAAASMWNYSPFRLAREHLKLVFVGRTAKFDQAKLWMFFWDVLLFSCFFGEEDDNNNNNNNNNNSSREQTNTQPRLWIWFIGVSHRWDFEQSCKEGLRCTYQNNLGLYYLEKIQTIKHFFKTNRRSSALNSAHALNIIKSKNISETEMNHALNFKMKN